MNRSFLHSWSISDLLLSHLTSSNTLQKSSRPPQRGPTGLWGEAARLGALTVTCCHMSVPQVNMRREKADFFLVLHAWGSCLDGPRATGSEPAPWDLTPDQQPLPGALPVHKCHRASSLPGSFGVGGVPGT